MKAGLYIPASVEAAENTIAAIDAAKLAALPKSEFIRIWCSVLYLNPGLHTDNFFDPDYTCEPIIRSILAEVWRRADAGEMGDSELYPYEVIQARLAA